MNFTITGDGISITDALREHVKKQFGRVLRNCEVVPSVIVVLKVNPHAKKKEERQTTSVTVRALEKESIAKSATSKSMYRSITSAADLVKQEIASRKERTPRGIKRRPDVIDKLDKLDKRVASTSQPPQGVDRRRTPQQMSV